MMDRHYAHGITEAEEQRWCWLVATVGAAKALAYIEKWEQQEERDATERGDRNHQEPLGD